MLQVFPEISNDNPGKQDKHFDVIVSNVIQPAIWWKSKRHSSPIRENSDLQRLHFLFSSYDKQSFTKSSGDNSVHFDDSKSQYKSESQNEHLSWVSA